jgi:hypothetical protein
MVSFLVIISSIFVTKSSLGSGAGLSIRKLPENKTTKFLLGLTRNFFCITLVWVMVFSANASVPVTMNVDFLIEKQIVTLMLPNPSRLILFWVI